MEEDSSTRRELTPAQKRRADSAGFAVLACIPWVFIWGAILQSQVSSIPIVVAMLGTFAFFFTVIHLGRRH